MSGLVYADMLAMQGDSGAQMTPEAQEQQQEAQRQQEERRQSMLAQVLQPQARERCEPHPPPNRLAASSSLRKTLRSPCGTLTGTMF